MKTLLRFLWKIVLLPFLVVMFVLAYFVFLFSPNLKNFKFVMKEKNHE